MFERLPAELRTETGVVHLPALAARGEPSFDEGLSGHGCASFEQIFVLLGNFVGREAREGRHLGIYTALGFAGWSS